MTKSEIGWWSSGPVSIVVFMAAAAFAQPLAPSVAGPGLTEGSGRETASIAPAAPGRVRRRLRAVAPDKEVIVTLPGDVPLVLVRIPAGTFEMGAPVDERGTESGEQPVHRVTISQDFYLGKYEVTQGQWRAVMGSNPSYFTSCGDTCPVEQVSWSDVTGSGGFLEKLNQHLSSTGQPGAGKYRLPSEAEWERAARGGTQTRFSYGDALGCGDRCETCAVHAQSMWWCGNAAGATRPVGQKAANPFGLYDVHGGVWEWVQDWYAPYSSSAQTDPQGPPSGSGRVVRGGSWGSYARYCRSAPRDGDDPVTSRYSDIGFRLARPL